MFEFWCSGPPFFSHIPYYNLNVLLPYDNNDNTNNDNNYHGNTEHIVNDDNNSIYVGDSAVSTSGADKGMTVKKDSIYTLELNALDKLYAVAAVATGANAVSVVYSRVI